MVCTLGINGFGRIGRLCLRASLHTEGAHVSCINDPGLGVEEAAYLFAHDTVFGRFQGTVSTLAGKSKGEGDALLINGRKIPFHREKDPAACPWSATGVHIVLEASGKFTAPGSGLEGHLKAGAHNVILTAPSKDEGIPCLVLGVNEETYTPTTMKVVSNASCTTNCVAPLAKAINDSFGIEAGLMTTIHAVTASQPCVDGPGKKGQLALGRSCLANIVPTTTGAASAVGRVLPQLKGKLDGCAFRVPVTDGSVVDLTVRTKQPATLQQVLDALRSAADGRMKGILRVSDVPLVSSDCVGETASCCVDARACMACGDRLFKLVAWYDNEGAYAQRCVDLARYMAGAGRQGAVEP